MKSVNGANKCVPRDVDLLIGHLYRFCSECYLSHKEYLKAHFVLDKAGKILVQYNDVYNIYFHRKGIAYFDECNYDEAYKWLLRARDEDSKHSSFHPEDKLLLNNLGHINYYLGGCYEKMETPNIKKVDKANDVIAYFEAARNLFNSLPKSEEIDTKLLLVTGEIERLQKYKKLMALMGPTV